MKSSVPNIRKDYVKSFCCRVALGSQPIYVRHEPLANKPLQECFSIVPEHIVANGGKQKFGWMISEIKRVWLEAEFHVVWEREDGILIDLTPRTISSGKILFVPDPERKYEGIQVESIFRAISKKPSVHQFIALAGEYYRALNEGDLANVKSGFVECPKAVEIKKKMDKIAITIFKEHF